METQGSATPTQSTEETTTTTAEATPEVKAQETKIEAPQPNLKKFKLKVDGEEVEEELDLNNEQDLIKRLQLARAAEKRISQAKSEKQKAMEILKAFEDGTLLRKHPKARDLAEQLLVEQLEDEMLSPEQKELKQLKKFKEDKEREELEKQKAIEMAAAQQKEKAIADQFQKTIIGALDKSGLPKTPDMAKRMAYIMKKNLDLGLQLTPDELAVEVKNELNTLLKALIGSAEGDQLIGLLGEDAAKKLRAYDVKRLKEGFKGSTTTKQEQTQKSIRKEDGKPMSLEEWKEQARMRAKS